ncbi:MAG: hypothetical protein AB1705_06495, partial [Verrucomicrobiota bacterium]
SPVSNRLGAGDPMQARSLRYGRLGGLRYQAGHALRLGSATAAVRRRCAPRLFARQSSFLS